MKSSLGVWKRCDAFIEAEGGRLSSGVEGVSTLFTGGTRQPSRARRRLE